MKTLIEELYSQAEMADKAAVRDAFFALRAALSKGEVRAAEPDPSSPVGWRVNTWVKQGILLGFRSGDNADVSADHGKWPFYDKDTLPLKKPGLEAGVRIVMVVGEVTTTLVAATPFTVTVAPVRKPVPVIVTVVSPVTGPLPVEALAAWNGHRLTRPVHRIEAVRFRCSRDALGLFAVELGRALRGFPVRQLRKIG